MMTYIEYIVMGIVTTVGFICLILASIIEQRTKKKIQGIRKLLTEYYDDVWDDERMDDEWIKKWEKLDGN